MRRQEEGSDRDKMTIQNRLWETNRQRIVRKPPNEKRDEWCILQEIQDGKWVRISAGPMAWVKARAIPGTPVLDLSEVRNANS